MILMFPLMMLLVTPHAANQEVKDMRLAVIDNDQSSYSQRLVRKTTASGYFQLTEVANSHEQALSAVEAGKADVILNIPLHFAQDIEKTGAADVQISINAVNGVKGGLGTSYLAGIVSDYASELSADKGLTAPPTIIKPQFRFNPHLDYKIFMIPAVMVMLLTMLSGFLPALNIVSEKEIGTMEQLNVTPVGRATFILAKLIPYWLLGFIVLSLCMGFVLLVYDLRPVGSLATIYLFASVYVLVVSGLGLIISNYSARMQQAMFVMFFFMMILILMSGLFTPIRSMPQWAQGITLVNPLRYFMEVMRAVYLKGSTTRDLLPQLTALCTFALVFYSWAIYSYRKRG